MTVRGLALLILILVAAASGVYCFAASPSATLSVTITPSGGSGGSTVCNNPAVPHPAQVANFTTLAYCADFTQQSATNNVVNHTSGTMAWTNRANWLDCAGSGSPQWALLNNNGKNNPCSGISVGNDPSSGSNALIMNVAPSDGGGVTLGIATQAPGFNYLMTYPGVNNYAEIKYRIDTAQTSNFGAFGNVFFDFWSWYATGCGFEIDFIETFAGGDTNMGITDWCNVSNHGTDGTKIGTNDNNYHVWGALTTSNGFSGPVGECVYNDDAAVATRPSGPTVCGTSVPSNSVEYNQMSWLLLWNNAAQDVAVSGNVTVWIEWIRVWSCAGWQTGSPMPNGGSNTCSTASPFTGTPP